MCLGSKKSKPAQAAAAPAPAPAPEIPVAPPPANIARDTQSTTPSAPTRTTSSDTGLMIPT